MRGELVESQRSQQAEDRLRGSLRHRKERAVIRPLVVRRGVQATPDLLQLPRRHQPRDLRARNPRRLQLARAPPRRASAPS